MKCIKLIGEIDNLNMKLRFNFQHVDSVEECYACNLIDDVIFLTIN